MKKGYFNVLNLVGLFLLIAGSFVSTIAQEREMGGIVPSARWFHNLGDNCRRSGVEMVQADATPDLAA